MRQIFLIGSHRSGTTWLGDILSRVDGVAYWSEPRQVWSYGNWFRKHDRLVGTDVTAGIARHVRSRFQHFAERRNATTFVEKTPSNCLRIPFMREIFPDASFVFLVRDGRAVLRSTDAIRQAGPDWNRVFDRVRESSLRELPSYLDKVPWVFRKLRGRKLEYWGARPPHWQAWVQEVRDERMTQLQMMAHQWASSVDCAAADFNEIPEEKKFQIRYEDFVLDPARLLVELSAHLELGDIEAATSFACETANAVGVHRWREAYDANDLRSIESIIRPTLRRLGYD